MTAVDAARVRRLIGGEPLAWLVERARDRWERGQPLGEALRLTSPTPEQREALAGLLGRRARARGALSVRVEDVELVLRAAGAAPDLRSAIEALSGPVVDRAGAREAREALWDSAYAVIDGAGARRPLLATWAEQVRAVGLLRRLAADGGEAVRLAEGAVRVVEVLPLGAPELRGRLARRVLGDAHALDDDRPVTTLVLRAAALMGADAGAAPGGTAPPGAAWRRRVWAAVGVEVGDLAAPVLTLGLPGDTVSATGRVLGLWREAGQPVQLTVRQLTLDPPAWSLSGVEVFVCENPSVVSMAADALAGRSAPVVCTHGQPSTAVAVLLDLLVGAGAGLRYHGDFDWGGLRIAAGVLARWPATPWRFGARAYREAVGAGLGGRALDATRAVSSPWDPALSEAMVEVGVAVEEEAVVDQLLIELGCDS